MNQERLKINLFGFNEEKKHDPNEVRVKYEKKLEKYRKKYLLQKQKYQAECENSKLYNEKNTENRLEIEILTSKILEIQGFNKSLSEELLQNQLKIKELEKKFGKTDAFEEDFLDTKPSLSNLQYENLKEKLNAKNSRVEELEIELYKESQNSENLLKEISILKVQIQNYND